MGTVWGAAASAQLGIGRGAGQQIMSCGSDGIYRQPHMDGSGSKPWGRSSANGNTIAGRKKRNKRKLGKDAPMQHRALEASGTLPFAIKQTPSRRHAGGWRPGEDHLGPLLRLRPPIRACIGTSVSETECK